MKTEAKIRWLTTEPELGIRFDDTGTVDVDADYVTSDEADITEWVENELAERHSAFLKAGEDFEILNMPELLDDVSWSEYEDKVDPGYAG